MPASPPLTPTTTLPSMASGADGDRVAQRVVGHLHAPAHGARRRIEGHEVRVERADVDAVVEQGDAAVGRDRTR